MVKFQKFVVNALLISFVLNTFAPISLAQNVKRDVAQQSVPTSLPPFPEDKKRMPFDWSTLDYEQEIILESDVEEFNEKVAKLESRGEWEEISTLEFPKRKMWDDEVLEEYGAPGYVKKLVQQYRNEGKKEQLAEAIRLEDPNNKNFETTETIIPISPNSENMEYEKMGELMKISSKNVKTFNRLNEENIRIDFKRNKKFMKDIMKEEITLSKQKKKRVTYNDQPKLNKILGVPTAIAADPPTDPLIDYYDGIEENTTDHILRYLTLNQNDDGSWGEFNKYELTAEIALLLDWYGFDANGQLNDAINFLKNTDPQNIREKAIKARLMIGLGEPYQTYINEVVASQNSNFGFGLDANYESDIETTLEVIRMLWVADQHISDIYPQALLYIMDSIENDGSMHYSTNDVPSYYLVNKTVEVLDPFKNLIVDTGTEQIHIGDKVNLMLGWLGTRYDTTNEELAESDNIIDELMTLRSFQLNDYEPSMQEVLFKNAEIQRWFNGSYGDSLYGSVAALRTLSQSDLEIISITNIGTLENQQNIQLNLTIKNHGYKKTGNVKLNLIVDNYQIIADQDITAETGFELLPKEEQTLSYTITGTRGFIGDTEIKFFIEDENELNYENNWKAEQFSIAAASDGSLAFPLEYAVYNFPVQAVPGVPEIGLAMSWGPYKTENYDLEVVGLFKPTGTSNWYGYVLTNGGKFIYNFPEQIFPEDVVIDATVGVFDWRSGDYITAPITQVQLSADETKHTSTLSGNISRYNEDCSNCTVSIAGRQTSTDGTGYFTSDSVPNGRVMIWPRYNPNERIRTAYSALAGRTTNDIEIITHLMKDDAPPIIETFEISGEEDFIVDNNQEASLYLKSSDDVAVKEADFYYYDPQEEYWLYIGTASDLGYISRPTGAETETTFNWYIPSDKFGTGYKVRAIVRDFYDQESGYTEWGPFEITDTTDYDPPVVDDLYISGESDFSMLNDRNVYLASWGSDNGEITYCEYFYYDPATDIWNFIDSRNCDGIGDVITWYIPPELVGTGYKVRVVMYDSFNNESAPGEWGPFEIVDSNPADIEDPTIDGLELRWSNNGVFINQRQYQLLVYGDDNVGYHEADFHYWDTVSGTWEYIGTELAQNPNQVVRYWTIPATVLGTGYKVRVVVRDLAGNQSDYVEFGPFEVIDGTVPEGTIEVQGLTDNTWYLGETKTIAWNVSVNNPPVNYGSMSLRYASNKSNHLGSPDNSATSLDHEISFNTTYVTDSAYITMEVCDAHHNCQDIESAPFEIVDNTAPPPKPWGTPESFMNITTPDLTRTLEDIHINTDGSIDVIYREFDGKYYQDPGQYKRIVYRKYANDAWEAPIILKEYLYRSGQTDYVSFQALDVDYTGDGDVHIVYEKQMGSGNAGLDATDVYYLHLQNGSIVSDTMISSADPVHAGRADVAAGSDGNVHIVWTEGRSYENSTGTSTLRYRTGDGANTWQNAQEIVNTYAGTPRMVLEQNTPAVLFSNNYQFYIIQKDGSTWELPTRIYNPAIPKEKLDIFTDDAAKLSLIVEDDPANPDNYLWLNSARTYEDLENTLTTNAFINQTEIQNAWKDNEYATNAYKRAMFSLGNGTYDFFFTTSRAEWGWRYDLMHFKFNVDENTGNITINVQPRRLVNIFGEEDVRTFDAVPRSEGRYHLFYVMQRNDSYMKTPYHLFYNGVSTYFKANVAPFTMGTSDSKIHAIEENDQVMVVFETYMTGAEQYFSNSADFSSLLGYQIDMIAPELNLTVDGTEVDLQWVQTAGNVDNYDVYIGNDIMNMNVVAQDTVSTTYTASALEDDATYYWYVVGKDSGTQVYSSIWSFQTDKGCMPPASGDWIVDESCIFTEVVTAPGDVVINNGIILTIDNNAALDIDMTNHALRVIQGGGVLIKPDGKIY